MNSIEIIFEWLLAASLRASVLAVVVLGIQFVLRHRLPAAWRHALWLPMLAVLVLPVLPEAPFALFPKKASAPVLTEMAVKPAAPAVNAAPAAPPASTLTMAAELAPDLAAAPTPVIEAAPIIAVAPAIEAAPVIEAAPIIAVAPAIEAAPIIEATPIIAATPVIEATPAPTSNVNFLAILWLAGASLVLGAGWIGYHRNMRSIRATATAPDRMLLAAIAEAAHEAGLSRAPRTWVSAAVSSPAVTGFLRPLLLLPAGFPAGFSATETRLILLHEFSHLKRLDLPLNWLMCLLQAMHWFNPLLWFAFARMRADRESACDARVLSIDATDRRAEYGCALLKLQCATPSQALSLGFVGIFERGSEIKARIREISAHRPGRAAWRLTGASLLTLLMAFGITKGQEAEPIPAAPAIADGKMDIDQARAELMRQMDEARERGEAWNRSASATADGKIDNADADRSKNVKIMDDLRRLLEIAERYYALGKYDDAGVIYETVLRIDQDNAAAKLGVERIAAAKSLSYMPDMSVMPHTMEDLKAVVKDIAAEDVPKLKGGMVYHGAHPWHGDLEWHRTRDGVEFRFLDRGETLVYKGPWNTEKDKAAAIVALIDLREQLKKKAPDFNKNMPVVEEVKTDDDAVYNAIVAAREKYALGQFALAKTHYESVLRIDPNNLVARLALEQFAAAAKLPFHGLDELRKAIRATEADYKSISARYTKILTDISRKEMFVKEQIQKIQSLEGAEFIECAASFDERTKSSFSAYFDAKKKIEELQAQGLGDNHPEIVSSRQRMEHKYVMIDTWREFLVDRYARDEYRVSKTPEHKELENLTAAENDLLQQMRIRLEAEEAKAAALAHPGTVIHILADGTIKIGGGKVDLTQLHEKLASMAAQNKNQPVVIRGDGEVTYKRVLEVVDTCQKAGIWNISFATQQPEPSK